MTKIAEILHIAAISQVFLLSVFFLRYRRLPGYIPFALLAVSVIGLLSVAYLYLSDLVFRLPTMAVLGFPMVAAMGPLFYIGIRSVVQGKTLFKGTDIAFFLVPLFELGQLTPYFVSSHADKVIYLREEFTYMHSDAILRCFLSTANNILFIGLAAARLIRRETSVEENSHSSEERKLLYFCFLLLVPFMKSFELGYPFLWKGRKSSACRRQA